MDGKKGEKLTMEIRLALGRLLRASSVGVYLRTYDVTLAMREGTDATGIWGYQKWKGRTTHHKQRCIAASGQI